MPSDIYAVGRHACTPTQTYIHRDTYSPMDTYTHISPTTLLIHAHTHIYGIWPPYLGFQQHHYQHCFMTHLL